MIEWHVNRLSVGLSDAEVEADIRATIARASDPEYTRSRARREKAAAYWTPARIRAAVREALRVHHGNQRLYGVVMGGFR